MLIRNAMILGFLIIVYYISLLGLNYFYDILDTELSFLGSRDEATPDSVEFLWNFIIYFLVPLFFVIGFIVATKPQPQIRYMS